MNDRKRTNLIVFICLSAVSIVMFQNCSSSGFGTLASSSLNEPTAAGSSPKLDYPYTSKPVFYKDVAVLAPSAAVSGLGQFDVAVAVSYPGDGAASIDYDIRVLDESGNEICPRAVGTLAPGASQIRMSCTSAIVTQHPRVTLNLVTVDAQESWTKKF